MKKNVGPYIAERLVYFKKGIGEITSISEDCITASKEGKVEISGLEFIIRTLFNGEFEISVKPQNLSDWDRFKNHIDRIKNREFWSSDDYHKNMKMLNEEFSCFAEKREEILIDKTRFKISGKFRNHNDDSAYKYVFYTIIQPLIMYKNFP